MRQKQLPLSDIVEELKIADESSRHRTILAKREPNLDSDLAEALKSLADNSLRADLAASLRFADALLTLGRMSEDPTITPLGLLARANAQGIGLARHQQAIDDYEQAAETYAKLGLPVLAAKSRIGELWSLASLGEYAAVDHTFHQAETTLKEEGESKLLGLLTMNMGAILDRQGHSSRALDFFNQAAELLEAGQASLGDIGGCEYNRSIALRNLGRFDESIESCQSAIQILHDVDHPISEARALQSMAMTRYLQGKYNEALLEVDSAISGFVHDGRDRDAALAQFFRCNCLLELGRLDDIIEATEPIAAEFHRLTLRFERAQTLMIRASAMSSLDKDKEAHELLREAMRLFELESNPLWISLAELQLAEFAHKSDDLDDALSLAERAGERLQSLGHLHHAASARLLAIEVLIRRDDTESATISLLETARLLSKIEVPSLQARWHVLSGRLAHLNEDRDSALSHYRQAIELIEDLRGNLMVEFRGDYLRDKFEPYESMVNLLVQRGELASAVAYAGRGKSRGLMELLSGVVHLDIRPKRKQERQLIEELHSERSRRDSLIRQYRSQYLQREVDEDEAAHLRAKTQREVLASERRAREMWHSLLMQNADYATRYLPSTYELGSIPQEQLESGEVLLEFFRSGNALMVFVTRRDTISCHQYRVSYSALIRELRLLHLHLQPTSSESSGDAPTALRQVRASLARLHELLIAPIRQEIREAQALIIAPDGELMYFPFAASYDGTKYLVEDFRICYLPVGHLLRYRRTGDMDPTHALVIGHSHSGRLPHAIEEAKAVSTILGGQLLLEGDATVQAFKREAPEASLVHIASHAEFRSDDVLFSGVELEDGMLTTLDLFQMDLDSDLIVLSACETGRAPSRAGRELQGLLRGCLAAGASMVLATHWRVDDESSRAMLVDFYRNLQASRRPSESLQLAQIRALRGELPGSREVHWEHPYAWAPYFQMGVW